MPTSPLPSFSQLRAFVALCDHQHFGEAAATLGVSQPSLSQAITALEKCVGGELVERTTRRVLVTPLGETLLPFAREAVLAAEIQGDIEAGRTPKRAVGLVVVLALLAVLGNWYLPGSILTMLINAIGMVLLIVWTFIIISLMRLHPSLERSGSLVIRMPGWPWLPWLVLAGLGGIGVLMLMSDEGRAQLVSMGALTLLIVAIYFVRQLVGSRKRA